MTNRHVPGYRWRRLVVGAGAFVAFLVAQYGAWVHELEHLREPWGQTTVATVATQAHAADRCDVCFGFAHVAVAAGTSPPTLPILGDLSYAIVATQAPASAARRLPPRRSRGPPGARATIRRLL